MASYGVTRPKWLKYMQRWCVLAKLTCRPNETQQTEPHASSRQHTILCYTMPCHAMPCDTMPYHTIPYHTILQMRWTLDHFKLLVGKNDTEEHFQILPMYWLGWSRIGILHIHYHFVSYYTHTWVTCHIIALIDVVYIKGDVLLDPKAKTFNAAVFMICCLQTFHICHWAWRIHFV